jgi:tRNA (guanine9-N1)-methyltransferase
MSKRFNALAHLYFTNHNDVDGGRAVMNEMQKAGVHCSRSTYRALFQLHMQRSSPVAAESVLEEMRQAAAAVAEERWKLQKRKDKQRHQARTKSVANRRHEMFATMTKQEREAYLTAHETKRRIKESKMRTQDAMVQAAIKSGEDGRPISAMRVVIDCCYENIMSPRELRSFGQQCALIYATMRRAATPVALHFCSCTGAVKAQLDKMQVEKWRGVRLHAESFEAVFSSSEPVEGEQTTAQQTAAQEVVYLSPDAEEVLGELDRQSVYVIGGLVDRTVKVNQSRSRVHVLNQMGANIRCCRLPIAECFPDAVHKVLNCDTVFAALQTQLHVQAGWVATAAVVAAAAAQEGVAEEEHETREAREAGECWGQALRRVVPARKSGAPKTSTTAQ